MYSSPVWSHPTPPYLRGLRFEQTLNLYYQRMIPHKSLLTIWFLKRRSLQISFCKILHTPPPPSVPDTFPGDHDLNKFVFRPTLLQDSSTKVTRFPQESWF